MKKRIEYAGVNPSLAAWVCEKLKAAPAELPAAGELLDGLENLRHGKSSALMLELSGDPEQPPADALRCGQMEIDPRARRVCVQGREIQLTPKEYDILWFLARNRGEVFTKEQIYRAVWDGEYLMDDSNIMAFIRKLRKKIEPNPDDPEYILTVWGIGYQFNDRL